MRRNRVTPLVFGEIFLQPILLDWWLKNTQNSLKLSQTQINKKAGFRIILQFPQRYFWGIRVPQKYLYVICNFKEYVQLETMLQIILALLSLFKKT
jgi:hypothetical protein